MPCLCPNDQRTTFKPRRAVGGGDDGVDPLRLHGEPPVGGPEVSSTYGQYDLCGFPKASSFWYRTQWLLTAADGTDKTFATQGAHQVYIVESWEPLTLTRTLTRTLPLTRPYP